MIAMQFNIEVLCYRLALLFPREGLGWVWGTSQVR
jgi:hypothetical protein